MSNRYCNYAMYITDDWRLSCENCDNSRKLNEKQIELLQSGKLNKIICGKEIEIK